MGLLSRFEDKAEDVVEGGARGGLEPVKIAKRAAKEMQREKMVGVGHEYAPTLYNVLVSEKDDDRMNGYYPSLAGEVETYLTSHAQKQNLVLDCPPLVRFIVDSGLKKGKFDIIAENVAPSIIEELRREEMAHYGLASQPKPANERPIKKTAGFDDGDFDPLVPADEQVANYMPAGADENFWDDMPSPEQEQEQAAPESNISASEVTTAFTGKPRSRVVLYNMDTNKRSEVSGVSARIGRETDNDVIVSDPGVSRYHAELIFDGNGWVLRDTNSTNGTFVNGVEISQSQLIDGDVIEVGDSQLEFQEG